MKIKKKIRDLCFKYKTLRKMYINLHWIKIILHGGIREQIYFVKKDVRVAYLAIAKAANTSIKNSMYTTGELDNKYMIHRFMEDNDEILPIANLKDVSMYFSFSFVRNPFDRLYSAYISKYKQDKKLLKEGKHISKVLVYDEYMFGIMRKDKGFQNYVNWVCKIPDRVADQHFRSQYYDLYKNGTPRVEYIGHFENLEEEYKPIQEKYGFKPLPHANKSEHGNWMDQYTLEMAEKVYKRYQKDFETFGYEDSYHELIAYIKAKERTNIENGTIRK